MTYRYRMVGSEPKLFPCVILDGSPLEAAPGDEVESPYHIDSPYLRIVASPISEIVAAAPKAPAVEQDNPDAQEA